MSKQDIYTALRAAGLTLAGACAMMGNMQAESTLKANIAQRGSTSLSDEAYTTAADNGAIDFVNDQVGYGLCQWTYYARKCNLLNFAKSKGVSVGVESMQVQFTIHELKTEYAVLFGYLCKTVDVAEATSRICKEFERPAVNNIVPRTNYAKMFYSEFKDIMIERNDVVKPKDDVIENSATDQSIMTLQAVLKWNCYWEKPCDGIYTKEFGEKLVEFANDVCKQGG